MPGIRAEESARAGCVIIALRGELDVCTAADVVGALTVLAAAGARVIVDLAELAYMDCYSLNQLMAVRAQARRAGSDLVLVGPQPVVLRLLVLCDMVSRRLVFISVDEAVSGAGSAPVPRHVRGSGRRGCLAGQVRDHVISAVQGRGGREACPHASRTHHRSQPQAARPGRHALGPYGSRQARPREPDLRPEQSGQHIQGRQVRRQRDRCPGKPDAASGKAPPAAATGRRRASRGQEGTSAWCAGPLRLAANGASEPGTLPRLRARPEPGPHESGGCRVFGVYAVLPITGARLGQAHGYQRIFLLGVGVFTLASLLCGLAPGPLLLVLARVFQGAGAALMFPQALTGIQLNFADDRRKRAIGLYAIALSTGAVVGQIVGGALISANIAGSHWRLIFLVNVPVGAAVIMAALRYLPADSPRKVRRLDLQGVATLSVGHGIWQ